MSTGKNAGQHEPLEQDEIDWERKRREARGWIEVLRLAERLRRERNGHPLLELVHAGAGREAGVSRKAPPCRTTGPAPLRLVREDRGDTG